MTVSSVSSSPALDASPRAPGDAPSALAGRSQSPELALELERFRSERQVEIDRAQAEQVARLRDLARYD